MHNAGLVRWTGFDDCFVARVLKNDMMFLKISARMIVKTNTNCIQKRSNSDACLSLTRCQNIIMDLTIDP